MAIRVSAINAKTLALMREKAGYACVEDAAEKLSFSKGKPEKLIAMEAGDAFPTVKQLDKIADQYAINPGILYLPPKRALEEIPNIDSIHDFRMKADQKKTPEMIRLLREVLARHELLSEILEDDDVIDLSWVGAYKNTNPVDAGAELRHLIWGADEPQANLNDWIKRTEERLGVAVMQPRPRHHTYAAHDNFSGLALDDERLPLIVLNPRHSDKRRLFTLLHELAHLMIKAPGITFIDEGKADEFPNNSEEEKTCNLIASNALLPEDVFRKHWKGGMESKHNIEESKENIERIVHATGASYSACAVRAAQLNFITYGEAKRLLNIYHKNNQTRASGGFPLKPQYIARGRVGPRMTLKSLLAYDEGRISALDLYDVFGVRLDHLPKIASAVNYTMVRWRPPPPRKVRAANT